MVPPGRLVAAGLTDLAPKLLQVEGFAEVAAALARGESAAVDGAWGSSSALAVAALAEGTERTLLVVLPRPSDLDDFAADLLGFLGTAPKSSRPGKRCRRTTAFATRSTAGGCACWAAWRKPSRRGSS